MRRLEAGLTIRLRFACSLADIVQSAVRRGRAPIALDIILSQMSASPSILHIGPGGLLFSCHIVTIRLSGGANKTVSNNSHCEWRLSAVNLLEAMRIYVRVVERGSISGAARDLSIGQPAASERIERLEKYLGCRLLLRSARAFNCTPEGVIFYERSKRILHAVEQAIAEVTNEGQALKGTIRIAAPHCFGETIVPEALTLVRATYPELDLELVLNDWIVDLVTEGVDISFRLGQLGEGAFLARQLGQVGRVLVAAPGYLSQHGPITEPSELVKHPFIRVQSLFGTDQLPLRHVATVVESVPIRTAIKTSHWRPMYEMILAGAGIGVLEEPACVNALAEGRLVRILPGFDLPSFELNLLSQTQRQVSARVRLIVMMLNACTPEILARVRAEIDAHFDRYHASEINKWHALRKSLSLIDNVSESRSFQMAQQLIVAVFDSVDVAERAGRDFRNFEEKDLGFKIESGVLVQKDAAGKLILLDKRTRPFWGTVIGALTGGLIGMLGGPVGAMLGFTIGASGGLAEHAIKDTLDDDLVASISSKLASNRVAFILEAQEASPFEVDNIVLGYGGSVFRKPLP
ncbi:hypothetical protein R69749_04720 [Paraburkholderia domus]|nr:LysR family transcriptional regulator [Burkholderia sp. R-69980]MBK5182537.1 LysR family transcriptional regulator [Burkholderia sp. R-69749]CAE6846909.1 hypothetical protein R69749_04720 [Paraburkholderia domus]CAE6898561.1 hypothetical protein R75471_02821 [Paraburkholderia domus]